MAASKLGLIPGKGYDNRTPRPRIWHKLSSSRLRAAILAGLERGALFGDVCRNHGVTPAQVRYRREIHPAFNKAMRTALQAGAASRLMPPETARLFLASCKWLGHIDVAREVIGINRAELALVFSVNHDFRDAAKKAFKIGKKLQNNGNGETFAFSDFGRNELQKLGRKALELESLGSRSKMF